MLINCKFCENEFECSTRKFNFNKKSGLNIFCSRNCYESFKKKERIVVNCANCGKEISKPKSHLAKSKTGNLYCSKSCSAANNNRLFKKWENHPNYTNGSSLYRQLKLNSVENPTCEKCGYDNIIALEVHHKDRNRKNNNIENLEILCANCHVLEHHNSKVQRVVG